VLAKRMRQGTLDMLIASEGEEIVCPKGTVCDRITRDANDQIVDGDFAAGEFSSSSPTPVNRNLSRSGRNEQKDPRKFVAPAVDWWAESARRAMVNLPAARARGDAPRTRPSRQALPSGDLAHTGVLPSGRAAPAWGSACLDG
jgi:hypothetical protein